VQEKSSAPPVTKSKGSANFPQHATAHDHKQSTSEQTAAKSDKAVHGGELFKSLFGKKERSNSDVKEMAKGQQGRNKKKDSLDQSSGRSRSYN